jgi:U4/U6 small nuclear ribonucleoprotein PRP3
VNAVRLANLMKVLTSDAVQDPTRVEAKVRREVAMRKHGHDKMNAERKLTEEQKREKVETKKVEEEKKGIFGAVFKYVSHIRCLSRCLILTWRTIG